MTETEQRHSAARRRRGRRVRRNRNLMAAAVLIAAAVLAGSGLWIWQALRGPDGEGVAVPDYVEQDLLPVNQWSRPGTTLERIDGVVIHYVGNPDTTAQANRNYFASLASGEEGIYASSHFIVGLEGEVIQCVPLTEIAYASNERNADTVAIEVCHPDETGEFSDVTYARVVELTAWLCEEFHLDPQTDVIRHYDVSGKQCPLYYVENPEAWTAFLADVTAQLEE
ncbi:peptidoglycan recognition protein family protein [Dysosmobacter sp.]|jgi:N-acetylmuramoyl-L-alanine amidase|uniref:peptidoglycan recognition protein family protein n=1 Tax=Dysosmobacter sp. TaxID=2591382 RepID=UPI003D8B7FCF